MNQRAYQLRRNSFALICLCLLAVNGYAQKTGGGPSSSSCSITKNNSEGWKRYYLEGPAGDAICVYLPQPPEHFPGGKLSGGRDVTLAVDVYLVAAHAETYAVVFVSDLPNTAEQMPDEQKAELFFGSWQAIIGTVRQQLERQLGAQVDLGYSDQTKMNVNGHEGRVQGFKVGSFIGEARMLFIEKRAYMLLGLWPAAEADKKSAAFFNSFETRLKH